MAFFIENSIVHSRLISKTYKNNQHVYSFRFSQKYRALATRDGTYLRLLTLHVDHDSAYK